MHVCVFAFGPKGLLGIRRLDVPAESFSSDSGVVYGKSLLHIFNSHGSENRERARMVY